jgi:hypothetical protein
VTNGKCEKESNPESARTSPGIKRRRKRKKKNVKNCASP